MELFTPENTQVYLRLPMIQVGHLERPAHLEYLERLEHLELLNC